MTKIMEGIRVLAVAQMTFVPSAGAILADWGADVIKIEHPVRGDTQRGFINMGGVKVNPRRSPFVEHPNRGKRSVGVDITTEEGMAVIYELAKTADVFLTNYLPRQRQKMKFDIEHIRAANPDIIYARGSAYGDKGPERDTGGFDGTAFWNRSGIATAMTPPARCMSSMNTSCAEGETLHRHGVSRLIRSKSSMENSAPASCATANRCRIVLLDPPMAMVMRTAFSSPWRVQMERGSTLSSPLR